MSETEIRERALVARIANLETGVANILGVAEQFDADADFRSIAAIAHYLLSPPIPKMTEGE